MMGRRRRLLICAAVRSFGTSRYRVADITPAGTARLRKPWSCGVTRSSASSSSCTVVQIGTAGWAGGDTVPRTTARVGVDVPFPCG